MQLKNYKTFFTQKLSSLYPKTEIDTFFFLLIEEYLGFQRVDTFLKSDFEISNDTKKLLNNALKRLQNKEPVQYILGKTEFYGFPFIVNKNTLIPRPETEELVEWIISEVEKLESFKVSKLSILDVGTGTGCIPVSLKKNLPNASISAIDVSKKALRIAKKNARLNDVEIHFFEKDILKTDSLDTIAIEKKQSQKNDDNYNEILDQHFDRFSVKFDIIVSNPPYVRESEKVEIKNNVLQNEPHVALFVEDKNPLVFYKKIADLAKKHLTKNGILFFEINQYLGKETVEMLEKKGFNPIELRKDLFGNNRMVKANLGSI